MPETTQDLAQTPLIYWKKEKKKDHWKPFRDTPGARQRAIDSGAMFFTWMGFSKPYTNSGAPEPMRSGDATLDFDDAENPENSLKDLRSLCLIHLPEIYGIDPYEIQFYLSGGKGFHAVIPKKCLDASGGDTHLPLIYKRMVAQWAASYDLKTIDQSLYCMKKGKMFRIPNVKRENGKYKVPLTVEEVRDLPYAELLSLGDAPRTIDQAVDDTDLEPVEDLADAFKKAKAEVHKELDERPTAPTVKLSKNDVKHLSKKVPPCIKHIISTMPPKSEKVNFNRLVMNLVKYFQTAGFDDKKALGAVSAFLEKYPHSDTYNAPEKRFQHWRELWLYLHGQDAPFQCSYIKGLGLPGNAFDCKKCLGKEKTEKRMADAGLDHETVMEALFANEDGDAKIFQYLYADKFIFDHGANLWAKWTGHYWQDDETEDSYKSIDGVVEIYKTAAIIEQEKADNAQKTEVKEWHEQRVKQLYKRAHKLSSASRKRNVLWLAGIGTGLTGKEWDKDPWKLACKNGVIDLKTGTLRHGKHSDFIKTATDIVFDEAADCPRWKRFLGEIFDHDEDLIDYIQRLFGYAITGLKREHVLPVLWGEGRNGKGTFFETIKEGLGDLAHKTKAESLLDTGKLKASGSADADIIALMGKRLVWASETNESGRMNVGRIKELVGGDTLNARAPYARRSVEFEPTHLLCLITNAKPYAPASDYALWQRMSLIPFTMSFVDDPKEEHERQVNKNLPDELKQELPGILTWLVCGCLEWQMKGLNPPGIVRAATEKYRKENDVLGDFLEARCIVQESADVQAGLLYKAYKFWAEEMGHKIINGTRFGKELQKRFAKEKSRNMVFYKGVGLVQEQ